MPATPARRIGVVPIAVIIVLASVVALLAGCGGSSSSNGGVAHFGLEYRVERYHQQRRGQP